MKKLKILIYVFIFLLGIFVLGRGKVFADWWERPSVQPTQPSIERPTTAPSPTQAPTQTPTSPPGQPTITPSPPPSGGLPTSAPTPTSTPSGEEGGEEEDACASGKSYTGPYCGWSPRIGGEEGDGGEGEEFIAQITGPEVLGLADTSGENLKASDIMLLTGVLCLLLYLRSKMLTGRSV